MTLETAGITADFRRDYGVHEFLLHDHTTATVVSAPDWEQSMALVRGHTFLYGTTVVTPELITLPDNNEAVDTAMTGRRVIDLQSHSKRWPDVSFIVGTPVRTSQANNSVDRCHDDRPLNGAVVVRDMLRLGHVGKTWLMGDEAEAFKAAGDDTASAEILPASGIAICRDIFTASGQPIIPEQATKLFVPAYWAVAPDNPERHRFTDERYFAMFLRMGMMDLFRLRPMIQDVVVADVQPPGVQTDGPFNAHFQRQNS